MSDESQGTVSPDEVRIRRAPRVPIFLVLGAVLGAVVTLIITASRPVDPSVGFGALYGYFLLYGVPAGLVVGGVVAVVLDRVASRRARTVMLERESVELPDDDVGSSDGEPAAGASGAGPPAALDSGADARD